MKTNQIIQGNVLDVLKTLPLDYIKLAEKRIANVEKTMF